VLLEIAGLKLKESQDAQWDLVSLGEVMLRFDPGEGRIARTREFKVWEGGGEYNVARGLRRCFGMRTSIVTALADNPVGRLLEDLMLQGGVDLSHLRWVAYDGIGRAARNGIYFLERGSGLRGALGMMDRGHTPISQLTPGQVDWDAIFAEEGVRWFHTGGIMCALSLQATAVARRRRELRLQLQTFAVEGAWRPAGIDGCEPEPDAVCGCVVWARGRRCRNDGDVVTGSSLA
jgi:2-dehydro-3-deoxygluconokinase